MPCPMLDNPLHVAKFCYILFEFIVYLNKFIFHETAIEAKAAQAASICDNTSAGLHDKKP